ncbi:hypothetical protein [uncultured Rubinisphaera sp.]|uniref:hypothetical protein n=1 Tax=uncultured Rubinisphaera sp. TaxID=1678686 RepID=UPI0030DBD493
MAGGIGVEHYYSLKGSEMSRTKKNNVTCEIATLDTKEIIFMLSMTDDHEIVLKTLKDSIAVLKDRYCDGEEMAGGGLLYIKKNFPLVIDFDVDDSLELDWI